MKSDFAFVFVSAVDGAREFGFAGAHQSVETDNLSGVDFEGNIVQPVVGEMLDLEDRIRAITLAGRVLLEYRFADHHLDQFRAVLDLCDGFRVDVLAVAHDRHIVSKFKDLIEPVGDVDDGDIFLAQAFDDGEQSCNFAFGDRGRRLIHDDDVGLGGDRLGNFHDLLLRHAQGSRPAAAA